MEKFYYSAINDVIREPNVDEAKAIILKRLKAKIIQLKSKYYRALQVDVGQSDRIREGPSLHHLLQGRKRQKQLIIHQVYDQNGTIQKTTVDLLRLFADHMRQKYDHILTSAESTRRILECGIKVILGSANAAWRNASHLTKYTARENKARQSPRARWNMPGILQAYMGDN
jgi:hypothetical protein